MTSTTDSSDVNKDRVRYINTTVTKLSLTLYDDEYFEISQKYRINCEGHKHPAVQKEVGVMFSDVARRGGCWEGRRQTDSVREDILASGADRLVKW